MLRASTCEDCILDLMPDMISMKISGRTLIMYLKLRAGSDILQLRFQVGFQCNIRVVMKDVYIPNLGLEVRQ